ncbi:DNA repair metallo-beta-lactamase-domain-containing protein [Dioszegia hungarica]|uniref:DNA repair metallo-beta-lactamase-domain-containing protein n=1 Tax=Dioszegia hungarica TaxID=4972 RepID=A0AA38LYC8_9TREE|nr:DNA repair metallo-beta-lactamase-domain-containing protein [Dioszegia hungarica]KAI9638791.1 DNA repair metallo-beta-lactamase-domain-containing protein [Dioszegia hungarica]
MRTSSASKKGKEKEVYGNEADPVVISDDEMTGDASSVVTPAPKAPVVRKESGLKRRKMSPPRPSPPLPSEPPPFANVPDFQPPPTWPEIINTAPDPAEEEGEDGDEHDRDDDSIAGRDYDHLLDSDDPDEGDEGDGEEDADGNRCETTILDLEEAEAEEIVPLDQPPGPPGRRQPSPTGSIGLNMGGLNLDMEWGEDMEEGMGMEDFGAEEGFDGEKHINSCLDTSSKSNSKSKPTSRPISSFNAFTPRPSASPSPPPDPKAGAGPNAFSVLMSGHKEREQWKDAEIDLSRNGTRIAGRRKAPFYKVMTGMPVAVDAFRYGAVPKVTAYLLSHAHSDHYTNLSKSWTHGPIYCSKTTGNLIIHMLGVEPQWVHGLDEDIPFEMPNTGGVKVTVIEANHCPGSSIFLFEGPQTVNAGDGGFRSPYVGSKRIFRYLHCGDFRACPKMVLHPDIARAKIDTCYLDTTYLNPKYCFPPQPQVIDACAQLARKVVVGLPDTAPPLVDLKPPIFDQKPDLDDNGDVKPDLGGGVGKFEPVLAEQQAEERGKAMMKDWLVNVKAEAGGGDTKDGVKTEGEELVEIDRKPKGRTLVVMGTYSIGKERIVKAVAKAIGSKIYCDPRKKGILLCETDPELHSLLTSDPLDAQVHLLPLGNIQLDRMQEYLVRLHPHFDRILSFRPTGWTYSPPAGTDLMPDVNMVIRRDQSRWFTDASLRPMRGSCRQFMMYAGVPYSEHSSFFELTCFALSLPGPDVKMIATVNVGNEKSRAKMKKWFEKWQAEKAKRKEKKLPAIVDYRDITYVSGALADWE